MTERERKLRELAAEAERKIPEVAAGRYRCKYHLMPPVGWLNDPNGLCKAGGLYHVFFQYAPQGADGSGMRSWGHYASPDLLHWKFYGVAIYPDTEYDADGAYSGSSVPEGNGFSVYYTGNVKHKDKIYDYITDGRESNTIRIDTEDGFHFGKKQVLMRTPDYPESFTRHIRDPKVEKTESGYEMTLGGRLKGDKGAVLYYHSDDGRDFSLQKVVTTPEKFGYMWECPGRFMLGGKPFLCLSPQGVPQEKYRFQNVYSSGYFSGEIDADHFTEWDTGFDFYAPQTFFDGKRRILYGWVGMPDVPYDNQPTVEEGWQHTLTLPRVLSRKGDKICQMPAEELKALQGEEIPLDSQCDSYVLSLDAIEAGTKAVLCDCLEIVFGNEECLFRFRGDAGRGRTVRYADISVKEARIWMDVSVCEIYLNGGEKVFTTRLYPDSYSVVIEGKCRASRHVMGAHDVQIEKLP